MARVTRPVVSDGITIRVQGCLREAWPYSWGCGDCRANGEGTRMLISPHTTHCTPAHHTPTHLHTRTPAHCTPHTAHRGLSRPQKQHPHGLRPLCLPASCEPFLQMLPFFALSHCPSPALLGLYLVCTGQASSVSRPLAHRLLCLRLLITEDFIYLFMRDTERGRDTGSGRRSRLQAKSPMWDSIR